MTKMDSIVCPRCDKSFDTEKSMKAHFAAKPDNKHDGSIAKTEKSCCKCGKTENIYESRRTSEGSKAEKYFCSKQCRAKHYGSKNKRRVFRVCSGCGNKYKTRPSENISYCSFDCRCKNYPTGEDNPLYTGGQNNEYYGRNWRKQRKICIKRDFEKCRKCRISRDEHKKEFGTDLHVHHKIPRKNFENIEKANMLHNLITLCASCHKKTERNIAEY